MQCGWSITSLIYINKQRLTNGYRDTMALEKPALFPMFAELHRFLFFLSKLLFFLNPCCLVRLALDRLQLLEKKLVHEAYLDLSEIKDIFQVVFRLVLLFLNQLKLVIFLIFLRRCRSYYYFTTTFCFFTGLRENPRSQVETMPAWSVLFEVLQLGKSDKSLRCLIQ